jgi:hypothetical protein
MDGMRIYGKHLLCVMLLGICMLFTGIAFGMETEAESDMPEDVSGASCSIFIYMCGSNLESKYGLASQNTTIMTIWTNKSSGPPLTRHSFQRNMT